MASITRMFGSTRRKTTKKTVRRTRTRAKLPRTVRVSKTQTGKSNIRKDKQLRALHPGKRISKNGRIYYERRRNRSDKNITKRL